MLFTLSGLLPQAAPVLPQAAIDAFTPAERKRLAAAAKVDDRIKVYTSAIIDRRRMVSAGMSGPDPQPVSEMLKSWTVILDYALEDIQANAGRKSRSRHLRRFEIELRKALGELDDLKVKGTFEQMQEIESWMKHAEQIRSATVGILFPG